MENEPDALPTTPLFHKPVSNESQTICPVHLLEGHINRHTEGLQDMNHSPKQIEIVYITKHVSLNLLFLACSMAITLAAVMNCYSLPIICKSWLGTSHRRSFLGDYDTTKRQLVTDHMI